MTKLVINADDFGYSNGINYGIVDSFRDGVLTSTTLMANMPGFEHAVSLGKENPKLGIGVHLSMTCGVPVLKNVNQMVSKNGTFKSLKQVKEEAHLTNLEQLYAEWHAQILKVKAAGIEPTHLDSHHYTHSLGKHYLVMEALAKEHHLPIRNCFGVKNKLNDSSICPVEEFWNLFNYPEMKDLSEIYEERKRNLFEILEKDALNFSTNQKVEAVCHPGYLDEETWFGSSFKQARMREVKLLCDPDLRQLLSQNGYELCTYEGL